ncbi:MAG: thermonuclease family protein [Blastomonas sp.]|nr:thermonuclease family protein [Blastomonas sp.]
MAKSYPIRARKTRQSDTRIIVLSLLLAALAGWNLNAWLMPAPPIVDSAALGLAATPDPWTDSREQRRLLEAQEGAPAAIAPFAGAPLSTDRAETVSARFGQCGGGARITCVVDGDTFWLNGQKIRIADIDTPEVSSPRCPAERERGRLATQRLTGLLNTGPFTLEPGDRATDRYGRALFIVTRGGTSVGETLVDEGLAVWYGNGRPDWC